MLECGFESRLGFEFSGFSMWHFLKLIVRGFHMAHNMLHMMNAQCVAHVLDRIVPGPLERMCSRQFAVQ